MDREKVIKGLKTCAAIHQGFICESCVYPGLGLSICRQIAQALGGSVYLDTEYTGGARFVFNVPVSGQTEG